MAISGAGWFALGFADGGIASGKSDAHNLKPGQDPLVAYDHSRGGVKALCPGRLASPPPHTRNKTPNFLVPL